MKLSLLASAAFAAAAIAASLPGLVRFRRADGNGTLDGGTANLEQVAGVVPGTFDEPLWSFTLKVNIGHEKQHIGSLVDQDLEDTIRRGLHTLCPQGRGACFTRPRKDFRFKVAWPRNGKLEEDTCILYVGRSSYDGPGSKIIMNERRNLMIDTIALAYRAMAKDKNCYKAQTKGNQFGQHCNVANWAEVNIADQDFIEAHLELKNDQGEFDCQSITSGVRGAMEQSQLKQYERVYHGAYLDKLAIECK